VLTGYSEEETFDASEGGVSLGRYRKSTGSYNFVALREPTPGLANAEPAVGPVVISEIMYDPLPTGEAEYVELLNISAEPVVLYDDARGAPWRFTDDPDDPGVTFSFPVAPAVTLGPGQCVVLTRDAVALQGAFAVPAGVAVLEWGAGRLSNGGEKIELSKPGDAEDDGEPPWIRVDRVVYSDGSHGADFASGVDPWPLEADGGGWSLHRTISTGYGNDPANWHAAEPSPGEEP
jgi:hypothetical protein